MKSVPRQHGDFREPGLGDGGDVRKLWRAFVAGIGQGPEPAGLDLRDRDRGGHDAHGDQAVDQVGDHRRRTLVHDRLELDAGHGAEHFTGHRLGAAGAAIGIRHAWIGFGHCDVVLHRLGRRGGRHQEKAGGNRKARDRDEILRLPAHARLEQGIVDDKRRAHQHGIAISLRCGDRIGADVAAGTRLGFNHEGLAQGFGEPYGYRAGLHVYHASRRIRHGLLLPTVLSQDSA